MATTKDFDSFKRQVISEAKRRHIGYLVPNSDELFYLWENNVSFIAVIVNHCTPEAQKKRHGLVEQENQLIRSHYSTHHGNLHHEDCPLCKEESPMEPKPQDDILDIEEILLSAEGLVEACRSQGWTKEEFLKELGQVLGILPQQSDTLEASISLAREMEPLLLDVMRQGFDDETIRLAQQIAFCRARRLHNASTK